VGRARTKIFTLARISADFPQKPEKWLIGRISFPERDFPNP
jgi:hypothetical protein